LVKDGKPAVLEGLDLGSCVSRWELGYLAGKVGQDRKVRSGTLERWRARLTPGQVVVHESVAQAMDFNAKNFRYVTTEFGEFAQRVEKGDKLYLRALSSEKPAERAALLADDFPALSPDFVLPAELSLVDKNLFSSVLRVSGPVNMWLHYDVSDLH